MGTDTPISALSDKPKLLYTYFKQNFAQVTNPPIDPIREELVMSLVSFIGPRPNLSTSKARHAASGSRCASRSSPTRISRRSAASAHVEDPFDTKTLDITYAAERGAAGMGTALDAPVRARRSGGARRLQHHHPVRPRGRARPHRRSRRCSPPRPCIIT